MFNPIKSLINEKTSIPFKRFLYFNQFLFKDFRYASCFIQFRNYYFANKDHWKFRRVWKYSKIVKIYERCTRSNSSTACRIFRLRGSAKCLGGPIFDGRNEILLLDKGLKAGVIFQKYSLKLIKIWKIIEKMQKNANVSEFINFLTGLWEK